MASSVQGSTTVFRGVRKKRTGQLSLTDGGVSFQEDGSNVVSTWKWSEVAAHKLNTAKNMLKFSLTDETAPVFTLENAKELERARQDIALRRTAAAGAAPVGAFRPGVASSAVYPAPPQPTGLRVRRTNTAPAAIVERAKKRESAKPLPPPDKKPKHQASRADQSNKVKETWLEERMRWELVHVIYVLCVFTTCWCATTAFSRNPSIGNLRPNSTIAAQAWSNGCEDGLQYCVCPRETICADSLKDMILLGIARSIVYFVYPFIWFLFLSKANFFNAWLQTTVVSVFLDFSEFHHLHRWGGMLVEWATWIHVFFHLLRWGLDGKIAFLWQHQTGITGLIATIVMPLITWPMAYNFFKTRMNFELRKSLHYLSWIWGVALIVHAPVSHIFYLCGIPMVIYWLNWFIGCFWGTYLVHSTIFRRLESGVSLTFDNPRGFELKGPSYVVIMLPWISRYQWHAFSIFPSHANSNQSSVCIAAIGDWSKQLHDTTLRPTSRPAWVSGPFLSPFATAIHFDNIVTLATGIGITPALCTVNMYRGTRRINLVWMCRDPSFVEFFVSTVDFPSDAFVLIYYTGKKQLVLPDEMPSNIFIFAGRPALEKVICGLVECIETETGLPENIAEEGKRIRDLDPARKFRAVVSRLLKIYSEVRFYVSCLEASEAARANLEKGVSSKQLDQTLHSAAKLRNRTRRASLETVVHQHRDAVAITKAGLTSAVNDFLGYEEFTPEDIDVIFDRFDTDRSGAIDQEEYELLIDYVYAGDDEEDDDWALEIEGGELYTAKSFFTPLKKGEVAKSDDNNYASKHKLDTWQMLYCGGSAPVVESLEMINKKYGIDLKIEKFDW
ncbi:NADPH oxidase 4 [Seminavis robusta]|uniref:NADPH oxidase 4 n=1 Tax=Seminavis robusta TaxID=568900 RepID=A0A9N8E6J4_9STRA|nr:NADPH oxidase 4 [Seminavis robusta]|eukprot:Sro716_g191910.1 NADPH oxidase 4 (841) ;mRNA; r:33865-36987